MWRWFSGVSGWAGAAVAQGDLAERIREQSSRCSPCADGWNDTSYYLRWPICEVSLTIYNSSSSEFTLKAMSIRIALHSIVVTCISCAWWAPSINPKTKQKGWKY
ncbi:MAG: hypothetical protein ACLVJK_07725 [Alistipes putredinis]